MHDSNSLGLICSGRQMAPAQREVGCTPPNFDKSVELILCAHVSPFPLSAIERPISETRANSCIWGPC